MTNVKSTVEATMPEQDVRVQRSRYWRQPLKLWVAASCLVLAHAALVAFIVFGARLFVHGQKEMGIAAIAALVVFGVFRVVAAWLATSLRCQLCHGDVLRNKRCRLHAKAKSLPLIGARMTAALSAMLTLHFTCMYCGSPYRMRQ